MNTKHRIRSTAAAALLLLPLAAAIVVEPAAAQQRATVAPRAPEIERFVVRPMGRLHAGQELRFRLRGDPGGRAWVDIPRVINGVELEETRPSVYEGTYTIRRRDDLDAFSRSIATLQKGNVRVSARVDVRGNDRDDDDRRPGRDDAAPQVTDLVPANGERVTERGRARISARLSDEGRGVDRDSVVLRLDGRDVTRAARITDDEVQYREDLAPGRHAVELTVRDRAGNTARRAWTFEVVDNDRDRDRRGGPAGALPLKLTSHTDDMRVDLTRPVTLRGRTAPNATVHVQVEARYVGGFSVSEPLLDRNIRADADGNFSVTVEPGRLPMPADHHEVRLTATSPAGTTHERLTLRRAG